MANLAEPRPIWWRVSTVAVVVSVLAAFLAAVWYLWPVTSRDPLARVTALQVAFTLAFGVGGLATLALVARRQWHQEVTHAAEHHDARERRLTEQYLAAVNQLGHDHASVRLAGLHALDRIGQAHPEQRDVIVDVWCGYLRRRFTPLAQTAGNGAAAVEEAALHDEFEVRMTAQRLLVGHLRHEGSINRDGNLAPPTGEGYWALEKLELNGATLIDADFTGCTLPRVHARGVRFHGRTVLADVYFTDRVTFTEARFADEADFAGAVFAADVDFTGSRFTGPAGFSTTVFRGLAVFNGSSFAAGATFARTRFGMDASYTKACFEDGVSFENAWFFFGVSFASMCVEGHAAFRGLRVMQRAVFTGAMFAGTVAFDSAQFGHSATFVRVWFEASAGFRDVFFDRNARFEDAHFGDVARFAKARFKGEAQFAAARFTGVNDFQAAEFVGRVDFTGAAFTGRAHLEEASIPPPELTENLTMTPPAAGPESTWPPGWQPEPAKSGWILRECCLGGRFGVDPGYVFGESSGLDVADCGGACGVVADASDRRGHPHQRIR